MTKKSSIISKNTLIDENNAVVEVGGTADTDPIAEIVDSVALAY